MQNVFCEGTATTNQYYLLIYKEVKTLSLSNPANVKLEKIIIIIKIEKNKK